MRKIIAPVHLSLDGLEIGTENSLDGAIYESEAEQQAFHNAIDTLIQGRGTYDLIRAWHTVRDSETASLEQAHIRWLESVPRIIISRTLDDAANPGESGSITWIKDNIAEQIQAIKQQPGKDMLFLGSPLLMQTFIEFNLIDEYRVYLHPVLKRQGKSPFSAVNDALTLRLQQTRALKNGIVALTYEPVRA